MSKLVVRDRFRLFFKGAVKELALVASLTREYRLYRDGMNNLVDALVDFGNPPKPQTLYVMIDSAVLLAIVHRVYGTGHPWTAKLVEFRRQFPGLEEPEARVTN